MKADTGRKRREGVVVSNAGRKTVVVEVARTVEDPTYKKFVRRIRKFMAHDEREECGIGDEVLIAECRPLSRRKRWRVERVLSKAQGVGNM